MRMKNYCVYCHTNKLNGKKYIGITSQNPEQRWRNGYGYKNNKYFFSAIEKYGWHNFQHEILYTNLEKNEAEALEIKLIREYNTNDHLKGYNIESGGNSVEKFTDEVKKKISLSLKGHICSKETRKKISESNKGKVSPNKNKKMSVEQIEKNRKSHLGQVAWNKGRSWTDEEKAKCGGKAVKCVETGVIYSTAHKASRELGIDFSSICKCRRGKAKTAGGYHWIAVGE